MDSFTDKIAKSLKQIGIKARPNANSGYWVPFLLPSAILVSWLKNPIVSTYQYKQVIILSFGLLLSSAVVLFQCMRKNSFEICTIHKITAIFTSTLFYVCLHKGVFPSLFAGYFCTYLYFYSLPRLMLKFPSSFSFGEATLAMQGLILFTYGSLFNILQSFMIVPTKTIQVINVILQVGISGLCFMIIIAFKFRSFKRPLPFYSLLLFTLIFCIYLPLYIIIKQNPVVWIVHFITDKFSTIKMMFFWILWSLLAVAAVYRQISGGKKASTAVRKIFHVLAVIVFLPGLIDQCLLLYLASGIVFGIFIGLEMLRILNMPPFGRFLQDGYTVFVDDKDVGLLALTPFYLLIGCSIPIWIHPEPCDVTDSAGFNFLPLISGLLAVGVGDTMASVFGSRFGKHHWKNSKKTFEGTLACIFSQVLLVVALICLDYIPNNPQYVIKAITAIVLSSLVEAKTDQVDNLVLPLIMYIILS